VFDVLNLTAQTERVTVDVRLPSGPVTPFSATLGANSVWPVDTTNAPRIPFGDGFSADFSETGGPGMVVDRAVLAPPGSPVPQWGANGAVSSSVMTVASRRWVLPASRTAANGPVPDAFAVALNVFNPGRSTVRVHVDVLTGNGPGDLGRAGTVDVPGGTTRVISTASLHGIDGRPLLVGSNGPIGVDEDLAATGAPGVVALAGVPLF
jgi:hypothetical protein